MIIHIYFLPLPYLQSKGKGTDTTSPSVWTPWACDNKKTKTIKVWNISQIISSNAPFSSGLGNRLMVWNDSRRVRQDEGEVTTVGRR